MNRLALSLQMFPRACVLLANSMAREETSALKAQISGAEEKVNNANAQVGFVQFFLVNFELHWVQVEKFKREAEIANAQVKPISTSLFL